MDYSAQVHMNPDQFSEDYLSWYVVRVKPQCEWKADANLASRGLETFLPTCSKAVTPRSRKSVKPLFPGYLFCRFDSNEMLPVLTTPGVLHVICFGNVPIPVDPQEIFSLQTVSRITQDLAPWPRYEDGQNVVISGGPLNEVSGRVMRDNGKTRLLVSISLLQRTVICEIEREWVEAHNLPSGVQHAVAAGVNR